MCYDTGTPDCGDSSCISQPFLDYCCWTCRGGGDNISLFVWLVCRHTKCWLECWSDHMIIVVELVDRTLITICFELLAAGNKPLTTCHGDFCSLPSDQKLVWQTDRWWERLSPETAVYTHNERLPTLLQAVMTQECSPHGREQKRAERDWSGRPGLLNDPSSSWRKRTICWTLLLYLVELLPLLVSCQYNTSKEHLNEFLVTRLSRSFQQLVNGAGSSESTAATHHRSTTNTNMRMLLLYKKSSKLSTITLLSCVKPLHNSWSGRPSLGCSTWLHTSWSGWCGAKWTHCSILEPGAPEKKRCLLSRMCLFHFSETTDIKYKKERNTVKTFRAGNTKRWA